MHNGPSPIPIVIIAMLILAMIWGIADLALDGIK